MMKSLGVDAMTFASSSAPLIRDRALSRVSSHSKWLSRLEASSRFRLDEAIAQRPPSIPHRGNKTMIRSMEGDEYVDNENRYH